MNVHESHLRGKVITMKEAVLGLTVFSFLAFAIFKTLRNFMKRYETLLVVSPGSLLYTYLN